MGVEHTFTITETPKEPVESPALVLYQGPPKTGKTHAMCTWPGLLVINWEYNAQTLARFPGVHVITPDTPLQFQEEILPWILSGQMKKEMDTVRTVGFDNITTWGRRLELEIREGRDGKMERDEWGVLLNRSQYVMSRFASICSQQDLNVVATVHEQEKVAQDRGETHVVDITPAFPGQLRNHLSAYFDMILLPYTNTGSQKVGDKFVATTEYLCRTRATDRFRTAGGTLWGKGTLDLPPSVDGTYQGLRKVCGLDQATEEA